MSAELLQQFWEAQLAFLAVAPSRSDPVGATASGYWPLPPVSLTRRPGQDPAGRGSLGRRRRAAATVSRYPGISFSARPVVNDYLVTGPRQMAGHRKSHHAKPEERELARLRSS